MSQITDILAETRHLLEQKARPRCGLSLINRQQHALQAAWLA